MVDQLETRVLGHSFDIGAFVVVVVADALGFVPLTQALFLVPLIWILLRMRHERWSTIGFSLPDDLARSIVVGMIAGVLMELLADCVTTPASAPSSAWSPITLASSVSKATQRCCSCSWF